jgi:hypothetical protein
MFIYVFIDLDFIRTLSAPYSGAYNYQTPKYGQFFSTGLNGVPVPVSQASSLPTLPIQQAPAPAPAPAPVSYGYQQAAPVQAAPAPIQQAPAPAPVSYGYQQAPVQAAPAPIQQAPAANYGYQQQAPVQQAPAPQSYSYGGQQGGQVAPQPAADQNAQGKK